MKLYSTNHKISSPIKYRDFLCWRSSKSLYQIGSYNADKTDDRVNANIRKVQDKGMTKLNYRFKSGKKWTYLLFLGLIINSFKYELKVLLNSWSFRTLNFTTKQL